MSDPTVSLGSGTPEEPIFELAGDCDDMIQGCLKSTNRGGDGHIKDLVESYERRFVAWWEYLGVFAERKANLDRRLRHHPHVRDLVLRLLVILRKNLRFLRQWLLAGEHDRARHNVEAESPRAGADVEMIDASSDVAVAHEAIDESLADLSQVGVGIRNSAKTTETTRARRYAATRVDLTMFEGVAFLAVETLFPNAPESLQAQLGRSMVDRYPRLLYRAIRRNILNTDSRKPAVDLNPPLIGSTAKTAIAEQQHLGTTKTNQNIALITPLSRELPTPSTFAPTSLDSKVFQDRLERLQLPKSRAGATTTVLGDTHEPAIPEYQNNPHVACLWCFASIPASFVENGRWTSAGREHYRMDLHPFPCLSEDCEEEEPSFPSITAWREHMNSHHASWPQVIHRQPTWRCPYGNEHEHESEAFFPSPDHLYGHLTVVHKKMCDGKDEESIVQQATGSMIDGQRPPNVCPFCGFTPEGMETCVPPPNDPDPVLASLDADPTVSGMEDLIPVSRAMETHITGHLQFLMLLSLRLMETQNTEPDNASQSGSMSPMESSVGCRSGTREDGNFDDLPSPPSSTPPRIPSPGLPESSGTVNVATPQSTLPHSDSHQVDNTAEDQSSVSTVEEAANPLLQMDQVLPEAGPEAQQTEEKSSQMSSTTTSASVPADNTKGKGKQAASIPPDKVTVESSNPKRRAGASSDPKRKVVWSDWSEWVWDDDRGRHWRARQDAQGTVVYEFPPPYREEETAPHSYYEAGETAPHPYETPHPYEAGEAALRGVQGWGESQAKGKGKAVVYKGHESYDDDENDPADARSSEAPEDLYELGYHDLTSGSLAGDFKDELDGDMGDAYLFSPDTSFTGGESSSMATAYDDKGDGNQEAPSPFSQPSPTPHEAQDTSRFTLEPSLKFRPGEVFKIMWSEPIRAGGASDNISNIAVRNLQPDDRSFYQGLRRFIIVANDEGHSTCVPILTYEHQACNKRGVKPLKHGIAYQKGKRPRMLQGEPQLGFEPIKVDLYETNEQLVKESRVNYAKLTTIEHNFPVYFIGRVDADDFKNIVKRAVDTCWQRKRRH